MKRYAETGQHQVRFDSGVACPAQRGGHPGAAARRQCWQSSRSQAAAKLRRVLDSRDLVKPVDETVEITEDELMNQRGRA